jgi:hypothetical protein
MNEVTLDCDDHRIQAFIETAVDRHIDTPVEYAFENGWPIELSFLEAEEVVSAVEKEPEFNEKHSDKERTLIYLDNELAQAHHKAQVQTAQPQ